MLNLMLIGLIIFALIASADMLLFQQPEGQVVYIQNGESGGSSSMNLFTFSVLLLIVVLLIAKIL